jgi:non-heme Fe2+,alpha-ketoglutarate-dependent halogenase
MAKVLSAEQLARYEQDGIIFPIPVLSAEEAGRYRSNLDEIESYLQANVKRLDHSHLFFRWAYELSSHPAVLDAIEDLLGPDILVHSSRIFYKHPWDGSFITWHQDGTYSNLACRPSPTAWIALTDSIPENGCLRVVPGSHKRGLLSHRESPSEDNLLSHGQQAEIEVEAGDVLDVVLRAGEMSIHQVNLLHSSLPNKSNMNRIGFSMTYITPAETRSIMPVLLARGRLTAGHEFDVWREPPDLNLTSAFAAHEEFTRAGGWRGLRLAVKGSEAERRREPCE